MSSKHLLSAKEPSERTKLNQKPSRRFYSSFRRLDQARPLFSWLSSERCTSSRIPDRHSLSLEPVESPTPINSRGFRTKLFARTSSSDRLTTRRGTTRSFTSVLSSGISSCSMLETLPRLEVRFRFPCFFIFDFEFDATRRLRADHLFFFGFL